MTMPHLMNCKHQGEGWCLVCVGELQAKLEKNENHTVCKLQTKLDKIKKFAQRQCDFNTEEAILWSQIVSMAVQS